jgi:hypothetical protein
MDQIMLFCYLIDFQFILLIYQLIAHFLAQELLIILMNLCLTFLGFKLIQAISIIQHHLKLIVNCKVKFIFLFFLKEFSLCHHF